MHALFLTHASSPLVPVHTELTYLVGPQRGLAEEAPSSHSILIFTLISSPLAIIRYSPLHINYSLLPLPSLPPSRPTSLPPFAWIPSKAPDPTDPPPLLPPSLPPFPPFFHYNQYSSYQRCDPFMTSLSPPPSLHPSFHINHDSSCP